MHNIGLFLSFLVLFHFTCSVLYTFEDFTAFTIPSADGLNISSHYICFVGWTILRYPSSIAIVCNSTLSSDMWPNEPSVSIGTPSIHTDYPPPMVDVTDLWFSTDWFSFGSCDSSIVQCNSSIPITNHTYAEDVDGVSSTDEISLSEGCPTNIVNYYNVCSNAAFLVMTFPMDQFEKSVWNRDQLIDFVYEHCNTTEVAMELGAYVQQERNHVDVDFSALMIRADLFFWIILGCSFFGGCFFMLLFGIIGYMLFRKKRTDVRERSAFPNDEETTSLS